MKSLALYLLRLIRPTHTHRLHGAITEIAQARLISCYSEAVPVGTALVIFLDEQGNWFVRPDSVKQAARFTPE